jgi:hypothetical protein
MSSTRDPSPNAAVGRHDLGICEQGRTLATARDPRLRAWLVFGSVHLLTGAAPLSGGQVVVLADLPVPDLLAPANTVVIRWAHLGTIQLSARTVDGSQAQTETTDGRRLFSGITPGPALRALVTEPSSLAPLFFLAATATQGGVDLHVHSQVRFHPEDACFLRITEVPLRARSVHDLSWRPIAPRPAPQARHDGTGGAIRRRGR